MTMRLIDAICARDLEWRHAKENHYYDNDFHLLMEKMMKQR